MDISPYLQLWTKNAFIPIHLYDIRKAMACIPRLGTEIYMREGKNVISLLSLDFVMASFPYIR
jgi:hypothetical protein